MHRAVVSYGSMWGEGPLTVLQLLRPAGSLCTPLCKLPPSKKITPPPEKKIWLWLCGIARTAESKHVVRRGTNLLEKRSGLKEDFLQSAAPFVSSRGHAYPDTGILAWRLPRARITKKAARLALQTSSSAWVRNFWDALCAV